MPITFKNNDDTASLDSSEGHSISTPPTTVFGAGDAPEAEIWDGNIYSVPWPGNTYIIYEKDTDKAITLDSQRGLRVEKFLHTGDERQHWLCVERQGYFGLHNPQRGVYIGHDDRGHGVARAKVQRDWESITPRAHPAGGHQLLLPHWHHTLTMLTVAEDGASIANRWHGTTVWQFRKV